MENQKIALKNFTEEELKEFMKEIGEKPFRGTQIYDDICDQVDGKDNGEYILLSKFEDDVVFEYHITIQEEDFNLGILKMKTPEGEFVADFDA